MATLFELDFYIWAHIAEFVGIKYMCSGFSVTCRCALEITQPIRRGCFQFCREFHDIFGQIRTNESRKSFSSSSTPALHSAMRTLEKIWAKSPKQTFQLIQDPSAISAWMREQNAILKW